MSRATTSLTRLLYRSLENLAGMGPASVQAEPLDCVIPAWSAGIQVEMDVSGRILRAWMPAIHAGMTEICIFMFCGRARAHEILCG